MYLKLVTCSAASLLVTAAAHFSAHGYVNLERKAGETFQHTKRAVVAGLAEDLGYRIPEPKAETLNVLEVIEREALRHKVSPALLRSLASVESGTNPWAISPAGAFGILQIMPFNAKRCGLKQPAELFEVEKNVACGALILSQELKAHGDDPVSALQAYNGGARCIGRCAESIAHSRKVLQLAARDIR